MLSDHFANAREGDDTAGGLDAATSVGTGDSLPAAESVGVIGGPPAPAPAAAGPGSGGDPDIDDEPRPGGPRLGHERPGPGSGSGDGPVSMPEGNPGSVVLGADPFLGLGPGEAAMGRFVADYLQLLDGRLATIRQCLDDSDIEGARVAVLSLESSSAMLGGTALTARLAELRAQLDLGPTPQRNALLSLVEVAASSFRGDLQHTNRA